MKSSLTEQLKRYRRPLLAAGAFFLCLAVFAAVWLLRVRGSGDKSLSIKWSDGYTLTTPAIEESVSQEFTFEQDILGLALYFVNEGDQPEGDLDLILTDAVTGEILGTSVGNMSNILSGQYAGMGVGSFIDGAQRTYRLTLTPHYTGTGRLCLGYSPDAPEGQLTVDGQPLEGGIAMTVTYNRVGGFLTRFWLTVALLISLIVGFTVYYCTGSNIKLHIITFVLVLALGAAYTAVLPPYASPDEQYHINQSFTIACRMANAFTSEDWQMGRVPAWISYRRPSDQNWLVQQEETNVFTWKVYGEQLFSRSPHPFDAHLELQESQADPKNSLYLLSGFVVFLCYLLRLGFVPTLLLGRAVNGLAYALLTACSVKRAPVAKAAFMAAALLPMSLHVGVSFSRDCLLIGFAYLFTALCLDFALTEKQLTPKNGWPLFGLAFLLAPAKYVYVPLLFLFFLIPAVRLGKRPVRVRLAFVGAVLAGLLVTSSFFYNHVTVPVGNGIAAVQEALHLDSHRLWDSEKDGAALLESLQDETYVHYEEELARAEEAEANLADSICYTPGYILTHPLDTLMLVLNSVVEQMDHYLRTLVGGSLSYYTIDIAWGWVLLLYGILAVACIPGPGEPVPALSVRLWLGLAALACAGLAVAGCVTWTPTYYTTIYGLQGRYLLPVLPAALAAMTLTGFSAKKPTGSGLAIAITTVNAGVLLNAMLAVLAR